MLFAKAACRACAHDAAHNQPHALLSEALNLAIDLSILLLVCLAEAAPTPLDEVVIARLVSQSFRGILKPSEKGVEFKTLRG